MAKRSVAILGGRGMLGTDLAEVCGQEGFSVRIFDLPEFDITNSEQLQQVVKGADLIVNCAAYTNVDGAESESERAYEINAAAVGRLGTLVERENLWLLHISTDFVFDGKLNRPYVETDLCNPINEYGKSKLAGEQLLVETGCQQCIMRIEWTYGRHGNNFVTKLIQRAKTCDSLSVVDDQVGSPTATSEVSRVICELLRRRPLGVFHFASAGYVSRYDMAKFVFDKLPMEVGVAPCKTSDFASAAARPLNSCFDCSKMTALLGAPIEPWQGPLERFLAQI